MGKTSKMLSKTLLAGVLCLSTIIQVNHRTYGQEENRINYALGGSATAQKSPIEYWGPDKLVDGIINRDAPKANQSRWSSEAGAPSWVMIDLKDVVAFDQIKIAWEKQNVRKYHIEISNEQSSWKNIYSSNDAESGHLQDTDVQLGHKEYGRYIKITVDALTTGSYPSVSLYEVEVYGPEKANEFEREFRVNYALNAVTDASHKPISYWGPDKLVDGIINRSADKSEQSRWSSEAGAPAWVSLDLKEAKSFDEILLAWENDCVESFHIEASDDGKTYETVFTSSNETSGHPLDTHVYLNSPIQKRYIKVFVDKLIKGAYPSVSLYEVELIGTHKMLNLAGGAKVTSNGDEAEKVKVSNINDGKLATRWGSSYGTDTSKQVNFVFDKVQDVRSFILEWERKTPTDFKLEAKLNDQWQEIYHQTEVVKNYQQIINLDTSIQTKEVRLIIDKFNTKGADREGVIVDYPTVSLHEVEIYSEPYDLPPRDGATTVQDIANEVTIDKISDDATSVAMPNVPEGYTISFLGADYEQVLNHELKIIKPLVDTNLVLNFEVVETKTGAKAITPDLPLTIKGQYKRSDSQNAKPKVVPELQQWFGKTDTFKITDTTKIVVDSNYLEFKDVAKKFSEDYQDIIGKKLTVVEGNSPQAGDFFFTKANENLEKETYILDIDNVLTVKADQSTGSYWATRSILQILKQTPETIAKGVVKDYPKYELRGMMLDVARLPVEMRFLKEVVKTMSWYKLNDFQVHLNDNVFTHTNGIPDYSGFRLESKVPNLTNSDVYYSKDEFRDFINESKSLGVNIVPEFDSPGHSGAFTRARPDLARGNEHEYLDVENPETIKFIESVFDEYTSGSNPVYPEGTVVHIGTDEYKRGNKEAFRKYQDQLLKYIRDEKGYTPRVWGSQTENSGETPITVDGVQMNLWYSGYARPKDMYELGYDLINTNDGDLYIVPGAGYYHDYLNQSHIYGNWQPNVVSGFKIPVGDDQMLGSTFAIWNDKTGPINDNGTSDIELFDRMYHIMPTYGAKLWGDIKDYSIAELNKVTKETNYAPNSNPTYQVKTVDETYVDYNFNTPKGLDHSNNKYDIVKQKNISYQDGLHHDALDLQGGESYVETPLNDIGINTTVEFWVNKDVTESNEEQILFESELGAIKAVQKETGKLGFSRWQRDYSFNYVLPENEWVQIKLVAEFTKTSLYVNGQKVDELSRTTEHGNKWASMVTPIKRIGSKKHAFNGMIDDVIIYQSTKENSTIETRWLKQELEIANEYLKNADKYTEASVQALKTVVEEVKTLLASDEITEEAVNTLLEKLAKSIDGLLISSDKSLLDGMIEKAQLLESNGALDKVHETVVQFFHTALANAISVSSDPEATQVEVDNAYQQLTYAIQLLDFKADKTLLKALIDECDAIDLSKYEAASQDEFKAALKNAKDVYDNPNALDEVSILKAVDELTKAKGNLVLKQINTGRLEYMIKIAEEALNNAGKYKQDEAWKVFVEKLNAAKEALAKLESQEAIDEATQALSDAYGNLRIKPDESIIEDLRKFLEETKNLDYGKYSLKTQKRIREAVETVEKVLANEESSQNELLAANALADEARELIKHPDAKEEDNKETGIATGDNSNVGILATAVLLGGLGVIITAKKRKED